MSEEQEQIIRDAFKAGLELGNHNSYFDKPLDEDEYIESLKPKQVKEETVDVSYKAIRLSCGWSDFCDVTGHNHWAVSEHGIDDSDRFNIPLSQYKKLNLKIN